MGAPVRVVVCDDHRVFAESVSQFLEGLAGIDVRATVFTGDDAVRAVRDGADVLLLDAALGDDCSGLDVVEAIRNRNLRVRVLLLSGNASPALVASALEAGAAGFCTKDVDPMQLASFIRSVAAGEVVMADQVATPVVQELARRRQLRRDAASRLASLTPRERQVLDQITVGHGLPEVARRLGLSPSTVRTHLRSAFGKLGVRSQLEAAALMRGYQDVCQDMRTSAAG